LIVKLDVHENLRHDTNLNLVTITFFTDTIVFDSKVYVRKYIKISIV
jgi:hypothetical protein